jgi:hypothetical protein
VIYADGQMEMASVVKILYAFLIFLVRGTYSAYLTLRNFIIIAKALFI